MNAPQDKTKKVHIRSFGCQMNVYDSERMGEILGKQGYRSVESADEADLVVLNTCHIREKAAEKVYSEIGRVRKDAPEAKIAVAGCVAQAEGAEVMRRAPDVSMVLGPSSYHTLPELEPKIWKGERVVATEFPEEDKFAVMGARPSSKRGPTAFLSVQEGCDKFCAFCVVPYTRGAEVSRPVADVMEEARRLVAEGVKELTLLGQNVNAYHGAAPSGEMGLGRLIYELAEIDGLERLRYTTSHPRDMDDELIRAHAEVDVLMPYLHLPVQSGSDHVLKRMNRGHTGAEYLRLIERIREARPDILMSGDFITGFPEESDQDFEDTMNLVREVGYGQAFSFKYSPRPGTPAAERDQVPEPVKAERLARLQEQLNADQARILQSMVGRTMDVLFEKPGREPGQMVGKSPYLHAVHVKADGIAVGDARKVRIIGAMRNSLSAELV